jgi:hypothetical protein
MPNFNALGNAIIKAFDNYRNALEKLVHKTLKDLSVSDPEASFEFIGGMGSWVFYRKGSEQFDDGSVGITCREIEPEPAFSAIVNAESEFGYSIVPDGHFVYKEG